MRLPIHNPQLPLLKYSIREIVDTAQTLKELDPGFQFIGENIGDPIAKGWNVPPFVKELLMEEIKKPDDAIFGYTHSRGNIETRKWVVEYAKRFSPSSTLSYEYVLFTSGLGAAIATLYSMLPEGARVLQPAPSYPTHSSIESFHAKSSPIFYTLDPHNDWEPDLEDMERKLTEHPDIAGILIINPNNPTGSVYRKETLEHMVALAQKYGVFIISDEVYFRMVYNGHTHVQITELAQGKVPLIVMRGLSKDVPWPGSRCGWIEFHNIELDEEYRQYAEALKKRILMEVCSTSLPQTLLPKIYDHPDFEQWNKDYNAELEQNGNFIAEILDNTPGIKVNRTNGAFYMMPLFEDGLLTARQSLPIKNPAVKAYIEQEVATPDFPLDKRFTYYLLAATGICVVPASGFYSPYPGFRLTTLDRDHARREKTYSTLSQSVTEYLASTSQISH